MTAKELGQQPAFPFVKVSESASHCHDESSEGMTLRQHIAVEMMKAYVTGFIANPGDGTCKPDLAAQRALIYTDALLEQLAKEST